MVSDQKPASEKKTVDEKKLATLEGEVKLLKGEIKQSLADVSSFLHHLKMPAPEEGEPFPSEEDRLSVDGRLSLDSKGSPSPPLAEQVTEAPAEEASPEEASPEAQNIPSPRASGVAKSSGTTVVEKYSGQTAATSPMSVTQETQQGEKTMSTEEKVQKMMKDKALPEPVQRTPQVNLLANLIQWVHRAKKEIGVNQLPTFLDVYSITGTLSEEIREVILKLAEVLTPAEGSDGSNGHSRSISEQVATFLEIHGVGGQLTPESRDSIVRLVKSLEQEPAEVNISDVWSQLILELHGILCGGGTPLRTYNTPAVERTAKMPTEKITMTPRAMQDKQTDGKDKPFRLKLVMPFGEGVEKEFDVV